MAEPKLYFVDDDRLLLALLDKYFKAAGFAVQTFDSGTKGLNAFKESPPDLLVTDIYMPDLDGIDLLRAIHSISPAAKVFTMTAHEPGTFIDPLELSLEQGSLKSFKKPFDFHIMLECILETLKSTPATT